MSGVYDNWNRLVEAVLKREELRQIALGESLNSSISDDFSSRFSLNSSHEVAAVGNSATGAIAEGIITTAVGNSSTAAIAEGITTAVGNSSTAAIAEASTTTVGNSSTGTIARRGVSRAARLFAAPAVAFAHYGRRKQRDYLVDVPARVKRDVRMGQFKRFSLREPEVATHNFSNKNFLGTGRFGKVYKGLLADGSLVAVKRLKEGKELSFQKEVEVFGMAVHRNVIRLRGFCMTPTERLLVYPFMVNRTVESWLRERLNHNLHLIGLKENG